MLRRRLRQKPANGVDERSDWHRPPVHVLVLEVVQANENVTVEEQRDDRLAELIRQVYLIADPGRLARGPRHDNHEHRAGSDLLLDFGRLPEARDDLLVEPRGNAVFGEEHAELADVGRRVLVAVADKDVTAHTRETSETSNRTAWTDQSALPYPVT